MNAKNWLRRRKWNRKRVLRVYCNINLKLHVKRKRRIPIRIKEKLLGNETWSIDFMSDVLSNGIELHYIQLGKPDQNTYIERQNRTFREDVSDTYLFDSIAEVNSIAYQWQIDYNGNHPHKSLNGLSPWLFAKESLAS